MKFVVTGGAGFIGSHIVDALVQRGDEVVVVDNLGTSCLDNIEQFLDKIDFVKGSINDLNLLKKVFEGADYVIHAAAIPSVPRSTENPVLTSETNIMGTLNVFVAARDCGVNRVVYASSSSIYGDSEVLPKVETMELNPLSIYASQKAMCEYFGKLFWNLYGLETIGLRYFNVFGPRQDPNSEYSAVIPKFIHLMLRGDSPTIYGDGETSRDFTYVTNVVDATLKACVSSKGVGKVFNIACGDRISLNDLVNQINSLLGTSIESKYGDFRQGDVKHSLADISAARETLGFECGIDFVEGLQKTIDSLR
tara:strand:+ start:1570 stop:2493 length:924 start_codon:yes stop_codon:yes gene_type:complete